MHQWYGISPLEGRTALCMTEMVKGGEGRAFWELGLRCGNMLWLKNEKESRTVLEKDDSPIPEESSSYQIPHF